MTNERMPDLEGRVIKGGPFHPDAKHAVALLGELRGYLHLMEFHEIVPGGATVGDVLVRHLDVVERVIHQWDLSRNPRLYAQANEIPFSEMRSVTE